MINPLTDEFDGFWWLVHTKPRNEKALAADLGRLGIACFLPLARVRRVYGGRVRESRLPLFPGYLFFGGGHDERYATLSTGRAVNVIEAADQASLKDDLRNVRRTVESHEPVDLFPSIRRGRRCRVVGGGLKGLEGVVLRRRDICRVYVAVEMLGQSAEVEIDPSLLEVL